MRPDCLASTLYCWLISLAPTETFFTPKAHATSRVELIGTRKSKCSGVTSNPMPCLFWPLRALGLDIVQGIHAGKTHTHKNIPKSLKSKYSPYSNFSYFEFLWESSPFWFPTVPPKNIRWKKCFSQSKTPSCRGALLSCALYYVGVFVHRQSCQVIGSCFL